jgi:hypothetical protein
MAVDTWRRDQEGKEASMFKYSSSKMDRAARERIRMLPSIGLHCVTSSGPVAPGVTRRESEGA